MDASSLYYQASGRINPIRQGLTYAICIVIAFILGYLYSVFVIIIPFVYFNIAIAYFIGYALGMISRVLLRFGHSRSRRAQVIQGVVIGILVNYVQWTVYILYFIYNKVPSFEMYFANLNWILIPENFISALIEINQNSSWIMLGASFKGPSLTIIWIIEFLIIMYGPIFSSLKSNTYPYSELFQKWYPKYTLYKDFETVTSDPVFINKLSTDPLDAIDSLQKGMAFRFVKVHIYYIPEEEIQYLTFEIIYLPNQGRGEKVGTCVINNFKINTQDANRILEKYPNNRERVDVI